MIPHTFETSTSDLTRTMNDINDIRKILAANKKCNDEALETKEKECTDLRKELRESKQMYERLLEERADVMEKVLKEESEERERAMAAKEEECVELRKELREIKQMYAQVIDGEQRTIASRDEVGANNIFRRFQRG